MTRRTLTALGIIAPDVALEAAEAAIGLGGIGGIGAAVAAGAALTGAGMAIKRRSRQPVVGGRRITSAPIRQAEWPGKPATIEGRTYPLSDLPGADPLRQFREAANDSAPDELPALVDTFHVIDVASPRPSDWTFISQGWMDDSFGVLTRVMDIPHPPIRRAAIDAMLTAKTFETCESFDYVQRAIGARRLRYTRIVVPVVGASGMVSILLLGTRHQ